MRYRGLQSERGAVLIHVAVGLVALIGFSALTVDYGVLWVSRRQAQNAADAAAHAAAEQISFGDPTDLTAATNAAISAASQNKIWGQAPDATTVAITFLPTCPPGAPGPPDKCVKADVWRNAEKSNPLPMYFGQIVGLTQQGVRATATAQLYQGDAATCVKPFAIPDKWTENQTPLWDPTDTFDRYYLNGPNVGTLIPNPDVYTPPSSSSTGTGFILPDDYGLQLTFKNGNPGDAIQPGWFYPVRLSDSDSGASDYSWNISNCNTTIIGPCPPTGPCNNKNVLDLETGDMVGPTKSGMADLIAEDPSAYWDPTANGGQGAPAGGCMAGGTCARSPRLVAVALFDPDSFAQGKTNGSSTVTVTHVLGFWINSMDSKKGDITGYITYYPLIASGTNDLTPSASFLRTVIFVR
jgi:hypothetical protein